MTTFGHILFGAAIAAALMPERPLRRSDAIGFFGILLAANLPDLPLPGWGHRVYPVSHSFFANGAIVAVLLLSGEGIARLRKTTLGRRWPCAVFLAAASHMVLDSFYNHGRGLAVFWPFDAGRLALPIPWFSTLNPSLPFWDGYNLSVMGVEILVYTPLLLTVLAVRRRRPVGGAAESVLESERF